MLLKLIGATHPTSTSGVAMQMPRIVSPAGRMRIPAAIFSEPRKLANEASSLLAYSHKQVIFRESIYYRRGWGIDQARDPTSYARQSRIYPIKLGYSFVCRGGSTRSLSAASGIRFAESPIDGQLTAYDCSRRTSRMLKRNGPESIEAISSFWDWLG